MNLNCGDRIWALALAKIVIVRRGRTDFYYHFHGCCTWEQQDCPWRKYEAEEWDGLEYL